ncbi:MAG TPA: hypothetical protein VH475_00610 [Tepidisphaeraceae bacterium]|jgi:hypothetical protein
MSKHLLATMVALALGAAACGKSKSSSDGAAGSGGSDGSVATEGGGGAGPKKIDISGVAAPHPLVAMLDPTASFIMLTVAVVDPVAQLGSATAPPLASMPLNTSASNCGPAPTDGGGGDAAAGDAGAAAPAGCAWSLSMVDITSISIGLVATLIDMRTSNPVWVLTGTGAGSMSTIDAHKASLAPLTNVRAFAISKGTETALAAFVGPVLSIPSPFTGAELEARGYMIGHVVGKVAQGAPPIAGATVAPGGTAQIDVIYPNADFSGVGNSTAPHGIFLAIPRVMGTPQSVVTSWTITPPAGETRTWPMYTAGTNPNNAFVILMVAND